MIKYEVLKTEYWFWLNLYAAVRSQFWTKISAGGLWDLSMFQALKSKLTNLI